MTDLAALFRNLLEAEDLLMLVDNIETTEYGLQYLWDGKLVCHIVDSTRDDDGIEVFIDVQDRIELPEDLSPYREYDSISQLVEAMAAPFKENYNGT